MFNSTMVNESKQPNTTPRQEDWGPINTFKKYEDQRDFDDTDDEGQGDELFQDIQLFLHAIGEPQLVEIFLKNKVTLGQLLEFNEQDLINCGVELVGDRKKIMENIGQMHSEKWQPASLHDLTAKTLLSSPGIYISLNDINKHMEYIGITFIYIKRRLQEKPSILELGKDYVGVTKISDEIEDLLKTSKTTFSQLKILQKEVRRHLKDPTKLPANHIDLIQNRKTKIRQRLAPILFVSVMLLLSYKLGRLFL